MKNEKERKESSKRRDAVILISSLDHDFFITPDKCLFNSWKKMLNRHKALFTKFKIPKIIYANPLVKKITEAIRRTLTCSPESAY